MTIICKKCGSDKVRRSGFVRGKQRFKCKNKDCGCNFILGDKRSKNGFGTFKDIGRLLFRRLKMGWRKIEWTWENRRMLAQPFKTLLKWFGISYLVVFVVMSVLVWLDVMKMEWLAKDTWKKWLASPVVSVSAISLLGGLALPKIFRFRRLKAGG